MVMRGTGQSTVGIPQQRLGWLFSPSSLCRVSRCRHRMTWRIHSIPRGLRRCPRADYVVSRPGGLPTVGWLITEQLSAAPVARPVGDGDGSYVLDPNGSREDWVRGHYERIRPCCTALPRGPCTRRPADPAAACPETPTPAQSPRPRPVRPLGPCAVLHGPHPPRIRGLRWWMRLLPANPTHRRARHDRGTACTVATDAVTGTVAAQQRAGGDTVQNRRNYRQGVVVW